MKKSIALLLTAGMLSAALWGCKGQQDEPAAESTADTANTADTTSATTENAHTVATQTSAVVPETTVHTPNTPTTTTITSTNNPETSTIPQATATQAPETSTAPVTTTTKAPVTTTKAPVTTTTKAPVTTTAPLPSTVAPPVDGLDHSPVEEIDTYSNPLLTANTPNAWSSYGYGDPFVMRYNGMYYLYMSTKDGNLGIKCWSSRDLISWTYQGLCSEDPVTVGAYAPEVFYYNGYFYMYTSPAGNGHYVLRSSSPTGPFTTISGNMGMGIDGSIFIDNDGKWYFYTSGGNAITSYTMTGPASMSYRGPINELSVNGGWTEGPMVVYHDGYYYVTYTGNHVLGKAYRIKYAASSHSPLSYNYALKNPLLVNTDDSIHGIGHSSTVKGPDLDSYYIVYHSLINLVPNRNMNIDRIVFNGGSMEIMGPVTDPQQVPSLPDVYAYFADGTLPAGWTLSGTLSNGQGLTLSANSHVLSSYTLGDQYTAEYNVASISAGGRAGALFSYTDENNYGMILFDPATQKVIITFMVNGASTVKEVDMIRSFGENVRFDCVQSIQVEKNGSAFTFYMNDRLLCTLESSLGKGAVGYRAEGASASFGFIGATGAVGGRGSADEYKSVSDKNGLIPATSYTIGNYATVTKDSLTAVAAQKGDVLNYRILAAKDGSYDLAVRYYTGGSSATLTVYVDGVGLYRMTLPASNSFTTQILRGIALTDGQHTVSFHIADGSANILKFELLLGKEVTALSKDYSSYYDPTSYVDGNWSLNSSVLSLSTATCGKRLYGDKNWGDYTVEADVTPMTNINCGLLVRTTDPGTTAFKGNGVTDANALEGTDWFMGYFIGLSSDQGVIIGKHSYSYQQVASGSFRFQTGTTYRLKAVCEGANIKVYVNGTLYIDYTDSDPFLQGMVGLRTHQCAADFDNFMVSPIE